MVMKEFNIELHKNTKWENPFSACIGYFDGLHLGHQELMRITKQDALKKNIKSALMTFDPDPWITLKIKNDIKHLTPLVLRKRLAREFGIDYWITLRFTEEMSQLSPEAFIELLNTIPLSSLICGFDFNYGKKGKGNIETLKAAIKNFELITVPPIVFKGAKISTTRICTLLEEGKVLEANQLLGYPFQMTGTVIHGKHLGSTIGFPTANLSYSNEFLLPKEGVYIGTAIVENIAYMAMINIGRNPTVEQRSSISIEVHILDFNKDIYEKELSIAFHNRIRDIIKFASINDLVRQLEVDCISTKEYFSYNSIM